KNGRTYPRRCAHGGGSVRTSHVVHVRVRRKGGRSYSRFDSTVRLLAKPFRRTALRRAVRAYEQKLNLVDLRVPPVPIGVLLERSRGLNDDDVVARAGHELESNR